MSCMILQRASRKSASLAGRNLIWACSLWASLRKSNTVEARVTSWYQMEEDWKVFFGVCIIEQLSFECMRLLAVCEDKKQTPQRRMVLLHILPFTSWKFTSTCSLLAIKCKHSIKIVNRDYEVTHQTYSFVWCDWINKTEEDLNDHERLGSIQQLEMIPFT